MDRDKIEFDINSMNDTEYKLKEIASLSPEEVDKLEKEKQVLFISVRDDIEPVSNVLVMAPKAWFKDEDDFTHRVSTDLRKYIIGAFENLFEEGVDDICEVIDHMGLIPFINYVSLDLMKQFSYPLDDTDSFEDFGEIDGEKQGLIKMMMGLMLNNTLVSNKALFDDSVLNTMIAQSEIVTGVMCVQSEYGASMKEAYVMKIRILNEYKIADDPDMAFVEDVKALYVDFLDREE